MKRVRPKNKTPTTFTSATLFDANQHTYQNCITISEACRQITEFTNRQWCSVVYNLIYNDIFH